MSWKVRCGPAAIPLAITARPLLPLAAAAVLPCFYFEPTGVQRYRQGRIEEGRTPGLLVCPSPLTGKNNRQRRCRFLHARIQSGLTPPRDLGWWTRPLNRERGYGPLSNASGRRFDSGHLHQPSWRSRAASKCPTIPGRGVRQLVGIASGRAKCCRAPGYFLRR